MFIIRLPISALVIIITWNTGNLSFHDSLVAIFCPSFRYCLGRPKSAEDDISQTRHNEASEEVESINVCCANWNSLTDCACKANDIDDNAKDICNLMLELVEDEKKHRLSG
jgi:hypothetical protein